MASYDTNKATISSYQPHGRIKIDVFETGVIKYSAIGPFNKELIEALAEIEVSALKDFKAQFGTWGELVVFEVSCMATEDALETLEKHLIKTQSEGNVHLASAFVIGDLVEGKVLMQRKYAKCFASANMQFKCFSNEEEAVAWLREKFSAANAG